MTMNRNLNSFYYTCRSCDPPLLKGQSQEIFEFSFFTKLHVLFPLEVPLDHFVLELQINSPGALDTGESISNTYIMKIGQTLNKFHYIVKIPILKLFKQLFLLLDIRGSKG